MTPVWGRGEVKAACSQPGALDTGGGGGGVIQDQRAASQTPVLSGSHLSPGQAVRARGAIWRITWSLEVVII